MRVFILMLLAITAILCGQIPVPIVCNVGITGPTQIASDNFNSYSNGDLTTVSGGKWTAGSGNFDVLSHQVQSNYTSTFTNLARWTGAGSFNDNQYSRLTIIAFSGSWQSMGPAVRVNSGLSTGYLTYWTGTNTVGLGKLVSGSWTTLNDTCGTVVVNDVIELDVTGSSTSVLTVKKNGATLCTYSDSSSPITTGTPGLFGNGALGLTGDNWVGGNTATSSVDPTKSAIAASFSDRTKSEITATVTLNSPVNVTVAPPSVTLTQSQTQTFSATVTNTGNTAVTWSLSPLVGSITAAGLYTAPASISSSQTITVKATGVADPTKSATAIVTLTPPVTVSLTPSSVSLLPSQNQRFTATVNGTSNTAVAWSINPALGGLVSGAATAVYVAPSTAPTTQSVTISAASMADPSKTAIAVITLPQAVTVSLSPSTVSLAPSGTQQFTATILGASNTAVTWSIDPSVGTISSAGLYTAPSSILTSQTVTVTAQSVADRTKSASAPISLSTPASPDPSFTYYVDSANGSDSNPGNQAAPWKTIAKVNSAELTPGQSVGFARGGVWRETLTPGQSGSAGSPITFGAYGSGSNPLVSGADLVTGWSTTYPVTLGHAMTILADPGGLTTTAAFESYDSRPAYAAKLSVTYLSALPAHIYGSPVAWTPNQLLRAGIPLIKETSLGALTADGEWYYDVSAQYLYVFSTTNPSTLIMEAARRDNAMLLSGKQFVNVVNMHFTTSNQIAVSLTGAGNSNIYACEIDYASNTGMMLEGGAFRIVVDGGSIHDNGQGGPALDGGGLGIGNGGAASHGILIQNMDIYRNDATTLGGSNVHVSMTNTGEIPYDIVLRYNTLRDDQVACGLTIDGGTVIAAYNIITGNRFCGFQVLPSTGETASLSAYHNVLYHNAGYGIVATDIRGGSGTVTAKNNLLLSNATSGAQAAVGWMTSGSLTFISDHNLILQTSGDRYFFFNASEYHLTDWRTNTSQDANSLVSDPLLTNPSASDFTLQSGSPAIGAGIYIPGVSTANPPNIGAK